MNIYFKFSLFAIVCRITIWIFAETVNGPLTQADSFEIAGRWLNIQVCQQFHALIVAFSELLPRQTESAREFFDRMENTAIVHYFFWHLRAGW